jgi:hypothetical protein
MNIKVIKFLTIFLFASVCTNAQEKKQINTGAISKTPVTYYDGKKQLTIYMLDGYLAEIGINSEKNSKVKSLDSSASPVRNIGFAQIFRVSDPNLVSGGKVAAKSQSAGNFSAVYSRSGDESSFILPVGIIVSYKITASDSQISELETKYSLKKGKKLPLANLKFYSYEAEAGKACIDLATTIRQESIVESTSVDFIEERSVR